MPAARKAFTPNHPIIVTFLIFAIIGFMMIAAEVLKPLALAILLAFALSPICSFLERRGFPRFLAAVATVLLALGTIGFIGYQVGGQLTSLANKLPDYEKNLTAKINKLQSGKPGTLDKIQGAVDDISKNLTKGETVDPDSIQNVRVVNQAKPSVISSYAATAGPVIESFGVFAFDLILVLFILNNREDLVDRLVRLFGRSKISLTTKSTGEIGQRISRYLTTFAMVNTSVGVIVGLGLWAIGLPYALVWGVLAGLLRFIPYAGPASAFALPFAFSLAYFDPKSWGPLEVLGLFGVLEASFNSFLEPMIYGKTTGVSALGLLVAAMFWTWLWGPLGLLLSTPLTVCLAVMGKYVPALRVFSTFLGEEAPLMPDVQFYQRVLARDRDGASEVADEVLTEHTKAELFDTILIPTLSMIERDTARDEIEESQRDYAWWVIDEIVQDVESGTLDEGPKVDAETRPVEADVRAGGKGPFTILGVPANDRGDQLSLRMLQVLLKDDGCTMSIGDPGETPLKVADRIAEEDPSLILISHLPPGGLTATRYLVRRVRSRLPNTPILVGRWSETDNEASAGQISSAGATHVVGSLVEARERILARRKGTTATEIGAVAKA